MKKAIKGLNILELVLSIISIALLLTILRPCESGMKCRTFNFVYIGLLSANIIGQILSLKFQKKNLSVVAATILPLGTFIDYKIIGLCKVATMRCNTITYPSVILITIVLTILNVILILLNFKVKRGIDEETN